MEGKVTTADAVLLAIGATALAVSGLESGLMHVALVGAGLVGLARATSPRLAIPLVLGLLLASFLFNLWELLPAELSPDFGFREESPLLHGLPALLGLAVKSLLLVVTALLGGRRVGRGLAALAVVFVAIGLLARFADTGIEAVMNEAQRNDRDGGILFVLDGTAGGMTNVGITLVAALWLAVPFAHALPAGRVRPALAIVGAVGALLVAATFSQPAGDPGHDMEWGEALYLGTAMIAWVLVAVGMFGLKRDTGNLAIAGAVAVLLQLLCCPLTGWMMSNVIENQLFVIVVVPSAMGLAGLALTCLPRQNGSILPLRVVVFALSLVAIFGVLITMLGFLLGTSEAIDLRIDDPLQPLVRYAIGGGMYALVAWAVLVTLLARRAPDEPTAPAAHPQPPMHSQSEVSVHDASQPSMTSS